MLQEQIRHFSKQIQDRYSPEKIILFGSQARNEARPDSDVDLLVVMDHDGKNIYLAAEMRAELRPSFPLDILVRRPADIESRIKLGDRFIHEIIDHGTVLYDRHRSRVDRES